MAQDFLLLGGHVGYEIYPPAAVAAFVSVPENELCKLVIESNARLSIKSQETTWFSVLQVYPLMGQPIPAHNLRDVVVFDSFCRQHIGSKNVESQGSELPFGPGMILVHSFEEQ